MNGESYENLNKLVPDVKPQSKQSHTLFPLQDEITTHHLPILLKAAGDYIKKEAKFLNLSNAKDLGEYNEIINDKNIKILQHKEQFAVETSKSRNGEYLTANTYSIFLVYEKTDYPKLFTGVKNYLEKIKQDISSKKTLNVSLLDRTKRAWQLVSEGIPSFYFEQTTEVSTLFAEIINSVEKNNKRVLTKKTEPVNVEVSQKTSFAEECLYATPNENYPIMEEKIATPEKLYGLGLGEEENIGRQDLAQPIKDNSVE